jgi:hypothetical protein
VHRLQTENGMALHLFTGIPVADYAAAPPWHVRFFGRQPVVLAARHRGGIGQSTSHAP